MNVAFENELIIPVLHLQEQDWVHYRQKLWMEIFNVKVLDNGNSHAKKELYIIYTIWYV